MLNNIVLINGGLTNSNGTAAVSLDISRNISVSGWGYFRPANSPNAFTINGQITGGSIGVLWDNSTLVLAGSDGYTGNTVIGTTGSYANQTGAGSPTLQLASSTALPQTTNVSFGTLGDYTATLDLNGYNATIAGLSGGTNAIVNSSSGTGTLTVGYNNAAGTFTGVLENTSTGQLALAKMGSGLLNLGGSSSFTGGTTLSGGTLQLGSATALGGGGLTLGGGLLDLNNFSPTVWQFGGTGGTVTSSVAGTPVLTVNNAVPGTFSGNIVGTPGLTLASGSLTLLGHDTYTGPTTVSGGGALLQVGSGATLGGAAGTALTLTSGGTLMLGDGNGPAARDRRQPERQRQHRGRQQQPPGPSPSITPAWCRTSLPAASAAPARYQNNVVLIKTGSGQLTLSGTSSFAGATTVSAGILNVTGSLGSTSVTVASGGTLEGTGVIGVNVTAGSNAVIGLLAGGSAGPLTISGSLTLGQASGSTRTLLDYVPGLGGIEAISSGPLKMNGIGVWINIIPLNDGTAYSSNSYASPGTYTLMNYLSVSGTNVDTFSLQKSISPNTFLSVAGGRLGYTIHVTGGSSSAGSLTLTVTGASAPPVAYFNKSLSLSYAWDDLSSAVEPQLVEPTPRAGRLPA